MQYIRNFEINAGRWIQLPIVFRPIKMLWTADAPNDCQLLALYSTDETIPWMFALYDMHRQDGISESFHLIAHSGNTALFGKGLRKGRYEDIPGNAAPDLDVGSTSTECGEDRTAS